MTWMIIPSGDGYFLFYQGTGKHSWWHVLGTSESRWNCWFPTLNEVLEKIKERA
jgi:hypothetical protein